MNVQTEITLMLFVIGIIMNLWNHFHDGYWVGVFAATSVILLSSFVEQIAGGIK